MQNKFIIYVPEITLRHRYIFKVLFNELYCIKYSLLQDKSVYLASEGVKLNYSKEPLCRDEIFVESNGLLSKKGINEIEINVQKINNQPAFFLTTNENSYPFDFFAASFYLISRYEEYLPHLKDRYNRYKPEESLAFNNGFLEKPIVNIWLKDFIDKFIDKFSPLSIISPTFKYISTIDIDNAYLYRGKGFVRSVAFLLKNIVAINFDELRMAFLVNIKKRKDPFDTFSLQFNLQKKYSLDVRYFILLGDYGMNDKNISHSNSELRGLVKRLADLAPVGLHTSFGSNINEKQLSIELNRLEDIQKREVNFSRQHLLQLSLPGTYKRLIQAGIGNDFSMGYASVLGFRAGIANPFTFYDLDSEEILPITIYPFVIVDDILKFNMNKAIGSLKVIYEFNLIDVNFIIL